MGWTLERQRSSSVGRISSSMLLYVSPLIRFYIADLISGLGNISKAVSIISQV
jgi:hypothetical protein